MRKQLPYGVAGAVALAIALAACQTDKVSLIRKGAETLCGVLPSAASVGAVIATGNPLAGAAADAVAKAICSAYKARVSPAVNTLVSPGCPMVGGVCVWAEKVDIDKLKAYKDE